MMTTRNSVAVTATAAPVDMPFAFDAELPLNQIRVGFSPAWFDSGNAQDRAALIGGLVPRDLERRDGGLDGFLVLGFGRMECAARWLGRVGRVLDDQWIGRLDPAAGEEDRMRLGSGGDGHGARARSAL